MHSTSRSSSPFPNFLKKFVPAGRAFLDLAGELVLHDFHLDGELGDLLVELRRFKRAVGLVLGGQLERKLLVDGATTFRHRVLFRIGGGLLLLAHDFPSGVGG